MLCVLIESSLSMNEHIFSGEKKFGFIQIQPFFTYPSTRPKCGPALNMARICREEPLMQFRNELLN